MTSPASVRQAPDDAKPAQAPDIASCHLGHVAPAVASQGSWRRVAGSVRFVGTLWQPVLFLGLVVAGLAIWMQMK